MPDAPHQANADQPPPHGLNLLAGLLACLLPGLGHVYRGELKRGVTACVGVLGLFFAGLFIGGIDVVDSREDRWWFYGQALVGPVALVTDAVHQNSFKALGPTHRSPNGPDVLRSGYPNERRVVGDDGVARWAELSSDELADGMGPPNNKSLARANELGMLYATIAGMMNLIIVLDALFPNLKPKGARAAPAAPTAPASEAAA